MHKKILLSALIAAASLALTGAAYAQDHRDDRHDDAHDMRPGPDSRNDRNDYHPHDDGHHAGPRGAGPRQDMFKGGRLPAEYRNRQYVVDDWRGHHLKAPPRGYHWVQTGNDYVLAAIATGVIADLLLNN